MLDALEHIDQQIFLSLNGQVSPFFDQMMFIISDKYVWIPFYLVILAFLIRRYSWKALWIVAGVIIMITLTDQISNLLKDGVKRFRPCKDPEIGHLVHTVNNYCRSAYGFVSAHASNSFALATLISLLYKKSWIVWGMFIWAAIVSYSRIYLGVHYPGDVLCGGLLGVLVAFLITRALRRVI